MKGTGWGWSDSNSQARFNTARKDYVCDRCGCLIPKGTYYEAVRPAFSYKPTTSHYHFGQSECEKAKNLALIKQALEGNAESKRTTAGSEEPSHPDPSGR